MNDPVPTPSPTPSPVERKAPRPPVPTLSGDGVHHDPVPNTGTEWLITPRKQPFWQHVRDLLIDGNWHHRDELYAIGKRHGLAERTVANLLPRASKRRWIERGRGYVRIRDRAAFEQALSADRSPVSPCVREAGR